MKATKRRRGRQRDKDDVEGELPGTPRSGHGEQTIKWLNEQLTPRSSAGDQEARFRIKASRGTPEALTSQPQRLLPAGTLVCFYDTSGSLLVCKGGSDNEQNLETVHPGLFKGKPL